MTTASLWWSRSCGRSLSPSGRSSPYIQQNLGRLQVHHTLATQADTPLRLVAPASTSNAAACVQWSIGWTSVGG